MLDDHLRRNDRVITLAQAARCGVSRHAVDRRVRSGRWLRCYPSVFFADDRPFTDAARVRAAVWAFGPRATATGLAAAWWHGVTRFAPEVVEVTVPRVSNHPRRPGIRLRRRDLDPHVELAQLWRAHMRNKGRQGSPAARRLLRAAQDGALSEAERIMVQLLRDAGSPGGRRTIPSAATRWTSRSPKRESR